MCDLIGIVSDKLKNSVLKRVFEFSKLFIRFSFPRYARRHSVDIQGRLWTQLKYVLRTHPILNYAHLDRRVNGIHLYL